MMTIENNENNKDDPVDITSLGEELYYAKFVSITVPKEDISEISYWFKVVTAAKDNPLLQEALDRVKTIYELSK